MGTESEANKNGDGKNDGSSGEQNKNSYENRPGMKKLIRILTVLAYLVSVSFVAIVLSAYYVFLWQPPDSKLIMHAQTDNEIHAEYLIDNNPSVHFKIHQDDINSLKSHDQFFNTTNYSYKRREVYDNYLKQLNNEENSTKIIENLKNKNENLMEKIGNSTKKIDNLSNKYRNLTILLDKNETNNDMAIFNSSMDKKSNNNDEMKKNLTKDENIEGKKWKKKFVNFHGIVRGMNNRKIANIHDDLSTASTANQSLDPLKPIKVSTMHAKRKMSAQNVMASITRTLGTRYETNAKAPNEVRLAGEESKDKLYEPKHQQKAFRVMTVIAYLISVSLAAIILSLYYSLIWDPKDHRKFSIRQQKLNLSAKIECVNPPDSIQFVDLPRSDGVLEDEKVSYKSNDGTFLDKLKADFVEEKDENLQDVDDLTNGTPATSSSSLEQDDNDDDEDFSSDDLGNRPEFQRELSPHR